MCVPRVIKLDFIECHMAGSGRCKSTFQFAANFSDITSGCENIRFQSIPVSERSCVVSRFYLRARFIDRRYCSDLTLILNDARAAGQAFLVSAMCADHLPKLVLHSAERPLPTFPANGIRLRPSPSSSDPECSHLMAAAFRGRGLSCQTAPTIRRRQGREKGTGSVFGGMKRAE